MDITPAQLRAARGLLGLSASEIAASAGLTREAISHFERGINRPHRSSLDAILQALDAAGVELTEGGVRLRRDSFREIAPPDAYLKLLDDAFFTLKDMGGAEVLFFYVANELSSQAVIDSARRMRGVGIRFRALINVEKPYCLFPLAEYRGIPAKLFHNNPILVYGDRVGAVIDPPVPSETDGTSCYVIRNPSYAAAMRRLFEALWLTHKMPEATTAPQTYE